MPTKLFTNENAKEFARKGGLAKRESGFKQQAQKWIRENGFEKAVTWVEKGSDRKATFAMGLLFSYALGKPAENIQIEDKREILIRLVSDPTLNELAKRFGAYAGRVPEISHGGVCNGYPKIQTALSSNVSL